MLCLRRRRRTYDRLVGEFGNAASESATPSASNRLAWLAGLLEAEGTFLRPPPSMPNCPIVACRMTDRDVVDRVATQFGTAVMAIDKGQYRTEYGATLKGEGAVAFMTELKPLMGQRRQQAIHMAIRRYRPPKRKLDFAGAEEIRRRSGTGESVSSLARSYNVARQTIHPILQNRIYRRPPSRPWRDPKQALPEAAAPAPGMSPGEFYWLAGWLEGEGSFLAPPPSDPRRPRISGKTRDRDVAFEVARLFRVRPSHENSERIRAHGWSPTWRVLLRGTRAIALMTALESIVGARRKGQIRAALDMTRLAKTKAPLKTNNGS
jgi:hypothetical protein